MGNIRKGNFAFDNYRMDILCLNLKIYIYMDCYNFYDIFSSRRKFIPRYVLPAKKEISETISC